VGALVRRMGIPTGTYALGPATGRLTLHTGRSGFGARAGHDLLIEATRWSGTVRVDDRIEASTVEVVVDATSLEVREGTGGVTPLLTINKAEIARTIKKVLRTREHPEIRFASTAVVQEGDGFAVHGDLTIVGVARPVDLIAQPGWTVTTTVVQSGFGITPYSAMFGALKVRDAVDVRAEVRLSDRR
jgi:polyisoprenoid-binding protein YceI